MQKLLTTDELKKIELDILKNVALFCDANEISYYLCGGTLLGAIRHKGFIPWDDDIDIAMPREDYIKFIKSYNGFNKNYQVNAIEIDPDWWIDIARVGDIRTKIYDNHWREKYREYHVFIDIFPLDGLPENKLQRTIFYYEQKVLGILHNGSACGYSESKHYSDAKGGFKNLKNMVRTVLKYGAITVFSVLNTQSLIRLIHKNAMRFPYKTAKTVAIAVICCGGIFEKASKEAFNKRMEFHFEDSTFWGPTGYNEYLTNLYGDYMTPPPAESQVSHHDFEAFSLATKE